MAKLLERLPDRDVETRTLVIAVIARIVSSATVRRSDREHPCRRSALPLPRSMRNAAYTQSGCIDATNVDDRPSASTA